MEISLPALSGIRQTHVRRSQLPLRPSSRLFDPLARAPPVVILVVERVPHRASLRAPLSESGGDQRSVTVNRASWSTALSMTM